MSLFSDNSSNKDHIIKKILHNDAVDVHKEEYFPNISESELSDLITASMIFPLHKIHLKIPSLIKFSERDIELIWKKIVYDDHYIKDNLDKTKFINQEFVMDNEFTLDELYVILSCLRININHKLEDYIRIYGSVFKLSRTAPQIKEQIETVKKWNDDQKKVFLDKFFERVESEKLFSLSISERPKDIVESGIVSKKFSYCRCNFNPDGSFIPCEDIDNEIDKLNTILSYNLQQMFAPNDLAILISEDVKFSIKQQAVLLGRRTLDFDVDIDITSVVNKKCSHVSKSQAIISFLEDCNFYIENIGKRAFRVNGVLLECGKTCMLKDGYLLDFSDCLFIFYSNTMLINEIKFLC